MARVAGFVLLTSMVAVMIAVVVLMIGTVALFIFAVQALRRIPLRSAGEPQEIQHY